MLFHEIHGSYFRAVSSILEKACSGGLTGRELTRLAAQNAFAESTLSIPAALKSGAWPLLKSDLTTVLRHPPSTPLTLLEKRWLKALLQDPRIALFSPDAFGLEEVAPLYRPGTFVWFDRYTDGDPYRDSTYIANFQTILQAIRAQRALEVTFQARSGARRGLVCFPHHLEYSPKDDKFRLQAAGRRTALTLNLSRILSCRLLEEQAPPGLQPPQGELRRLELLLRDERNALERALLHFSHLGKETRRLEEDLYQITLWYDKEDETELLIRVLSFGPVLQVVSPAAFAGLVQERLARQRELWV